jgi:hypothetical protein
MPHGVQYFDHKPSVNIPEDFIKLVFTVVRTEATLLIFVHPRETSTSSSTIAKQTGSVAMMCTHVPLQESWLFPLDLSSTGSTQYESS